MSDLTNLAQAHDEGYTALLEAIRQIAGQARVRATVGSHMVRLTMYWKIGREILSRQEASGTGSRGYGAQVITRLAADIAADPSLKSIGASKRNLQYMRRFAAAWPDWEKVQPPVALSSWKHQTILLDRLDDPALRVRYAAWSAENGWSANTLALQIALGRSTAPLVVSRYRLNAPIDQQGQLPPDLTGALPDPVSLAEKYAEVVIEESRRTTQPQEQADD